MLRAQLAQLRQRVGAGHYCFWHSLGSAMALLDICQSAPATLEKLNIEQIVATAGDGNLGDDSECSRELRSYLASAPLETLSRYAERCLDTAFTHSGRVLQDIINEVGRRLDYEVKNGRYAGAKGKVGFDGIWLSPEGHALIIEVKTTDAYRMPLKTVVEYRRTLLAQDAITEPASIILVVGREDTGELEAQVRGSRWAWDIRLISVDALLSLARLKQEADDPETVRKIRALLIPFDYTRLDEIIDVMFSTAKDVSRSDEVAEESTSAADEESGVTLAIPLDREAVSAKRYELVRAISSKYGKSLVQKSRATYWNATRDFRVVCSISRPHTQKTIYRYWYAFHPKWDEFLSGCADAYVVWGCLDRDIAFILPYAELKPLLNKMATTVRANGTMYWHIKIVETSPENFFLRPTNGSDVPLVQRSMPLDMPSNVQAG